MASDNSSVNSSGEVVVERVGLSCKSCYSNHV